MLDRLIESENNTTENFRRNNFFLSTLSIVAILLSGAMLYSLYAKPLGTDNESIELSSLVAPVTVTEIEPAVEPPKKDLHNYLEDNKGRPIDKITRVINQKDANESPDIPNGTSTVKNQYASRPAAPFELSNVNSDGIISNSKRESDEITKATGITIPKQISIADTNEIEPPKMQPKTETKISAKPPTKTLGVINGIAKSLPVPAYPPPAKAVHASGVVNVQVMIDEQGKVISANAVSGHVLLRQAAEQAAKRAVFSPTFLSNIPVKVTGVIVYNFVPQ